jgi:hypothetical protein
MLRAFLVVCALFLSACQSEQLDLTGPIEPGDTNAEGVSFARDIAPVMNSSCGGSGCHISEPNSGVRLSSYSAVIGSVGQQYGGLIVRPGNAAASPLVDKLEPAPQFGSRMPLGRSPLSSADIARIRTWIDAGAEDN